MRNKSQNQVEIVKVAEGKFSFELQVNATWDWNRDIAGPVPGDSFNSSFLSPRQIKQSDTLHKAFQREVADRLFDRCENMFESVQLVKPSFTADMNAAYANVRAALTGADRQAAEAELRAAEEKAARLRKQLGK